MDVDVLNVFQLGRYAQAGDRQGKVFLWCAKGNDPKHAILSKCFYSCREPYRCSMTWCTSQRAHGEVSPSHQSEESSSSDMETCLFLLLPAAVDGPLTDVRDEDVLSAGATAPLAARSPTNSSDVHSVLHFGHLRSGCARKKAAVQRSCRRQWQSRFEHR